MCSISGEQVAQMEASHLLTTKYVNIDTIINHQKPTSTKRPPMTDSHRQAPPPPPVSPQSKSVTKQRTHVVANDNRLSSTAHSLSAYRLFNLTTSKPSAADRPEPVTSAQSVSAGKTSGLGSDQRSLGLMPKKFLCFRPIFVFLCVCVPRKSVRRAARLSPNGAGTSVHEEWGDGMTASNSVNWFSRKWISTA